MRGGRNGVCPRNWEVRKSQLHRGLNALLTHWEPSRGRASHSAGTGGLWASRRWLGPFFSLRKAQGTTQAMLVPPVSHPGFWGPLLPSPHSRGRVFLTLFSSSLATAEWWGGKCTLICGFVTSCDIKWASLVGQLLKNPPAQSPGLGWDGAACTWCGPVGIGGRFWESKWREWESKSHWGYHMYPILPWVLLWS